MRRVCPLSVVSCPSVTGPRTRSRGTAVAAWASGALDCARAEVAINAIPRQRRRNSVLNGVDFKLFILGRRLGRQRCPGTQFGQVEKEQTRKPIRISIGPECASSLWLGANKLISEKRFIAIESTKLILKAFLRFN